MLSIALALATVVCLAYATPWQPSIRGCAAEILNNGTTYKLVYTTTFSQFIQCDYLHDNHDGSSSGAYCFYDFHNYTLYHYPNTPIPVDSSPGCPPTTPLAGKYLIKTSSAVPGLCVTQTNGTNGARVQVRDCNYRLGLPSQKWSFIGSIIMMKAADSGLATDKCIDVTEGVNTDGVKLQTWDCVAELAARNQQFLHHGRDVVTLPTEFIQWRPESWLCADLTDGRQVNGNSVQLWSCNFQNPNQIWHLEPVV